MVDVGEVEEVFPEGFCPELSLGIALPEAVIELSPVLAFDCRSALTVAVLSIVVGVPDDVIVGSMVGVGVGVSVGDSEEKRRH